MGGSFHVTLREYSSHCIVSSILMVRKGRFFLFDVVCLFSDVNFTRASGYLSGRIILFRSVLHSYFCKIRGL